MDDSTDMSDALGNSVGYDNRPVLGSGDDGFYDYYDVLEAGPRDELEFEDHFNEVEAASMDED